MNTSGAIVRSGTKTIYTFGMAVLPVSIDSTIYRDVYHIGVNLNTGRVDDVRDMYPQIARFEELNQKEQDNLAKHIPIYHKLNRNVLAISGKARSGKDELAKNVCNYFNGVKIQALADPIKEISNILYGKPPSGKKDREKYILVGQGLRQVDPNIWIKVWLANAIWRIQNRQAYKLVCPDIRQPNEFTFFKSMGALTVKVVADEKKRLDKIRELDGEEAIDEKLLNHETESHVDGFDTHITIHNNYEEEYEIQIMTEVIEKLVHRGW